MATKPAAPPNLAGLSADLLGASPQSATPQGGVEFGFDGSSGARAGADSAFAQKPQFAGLGPLLELPPQSAFKQADELVRRQELLAQNRLAIDTHYTYIKLGYPWSILAKEPGRDVYTQSLPYGQAAIRVQAVPNKIWDLINKTTQQLLQDFPSVEVEPSSGDERAQSACEMAQRFLTVTSGEEGTDDEALFHDRVERSLTTASAFVEVWTDPTGGGYIPLQIKAHPLAADPQNALVGPDGSPTTDFVLRYVTEADEQGLRQFTDNPSEAAPQWVPSIRCSKWEREHVRCYPESQPVHRADKVIIVGFCTLGEAKKRWPAVASMAPDDLTDLCDWTPERYLPLLPPFQRARWRLTDGKDKQKGGASDERIIFYYHVFAKATPDYPRGCDVVLSGANDGTVLDRKTLATEIEVPSPTGRKTEVRCMEIPVVQVTPRQDPDERDPMGRAYVELFAGAAENNAALAQSYVRALDIMLHLEKYLPATSPVSGAQIEAARRTGDAIRIAKPEDKPIYGQSPPIPSDFFRMYERTDLAIDSIAASERAASGAENSRERSGKALQIAVSQNNIGLSGMNTAVNNAYARFERLKIERCMADFTTAQQIAFVGEDGAYKQQEWTGTDFALVGKVTIRAGSGTLMTPDNKVQYLGNLVASQMLTTEEASAAARPSFSNRLGLPPDAQRQRMARQLDAFYEGPPEGWMQHYTAFQRAKAVSDQANAVAQQQFVQVQLDEQAKAQNAAQTSTPFQTQPLQPPAPQQPLDPVTGQPMAPPWSPFAELPMDSEPMIASMRQTELRNMMATVDFSRQPAEWQSMAITAYNNARNAVAAAQPQPALPKGVSIGVTATPQDVGAAENAAAHPTQQPPQAPQAAEAPSPEQSPITAARLGAKS